LSLRVEAFGDAPRLLIGLRRLREQGLTPRDLLFVALSPSGAIHVALPAEPIATGLEEKLTLEWPLDGRFFHFDALHRLPGGVLVWNGDRRLKDPGNAPEVAEALAVFLSRTGVDNVLFGCRPHQMGSWMAKKAQAVALHEVGVVEVLPVGTGLLARKVMDDRLFYLSLEELAVTGRLDGFTPVFTSPLGNLLMLERRVTNQRLVLSCQRGLVELDVSWLPDVAEVARTPTDGTLAVLGRMEGGGFVVTSGRPEAWGLADVRPASLVRSSGASLLELGRAVQQ
jgi:hypothetical protein